jgi:hypothetical protein
MPANVSLRSAGLGKYEDASMIIDAATLDPAYAYKLLIGV